MRSKISWKVNSVEIGNTLMQCRLRATLTDTLVFRCTIRISEGETAAEEAHVTYEREIAEKDAVLKEQKVNLEWLQAALDKAEERNHILESKLQEGIVSAPRDRSPVLHRNFHRCSAPLTALCPNANSCHISSPLLGEMPF